MSRVLDEPEYPNYICDDLSPVLKLLKESYSIEISEVHLDMKSVCTDVYLDREIPGEAIESLGREFKGNEYLRFAERWIACKEHYCSVGWTPPEESKGMAGGRARAWDRIRQIVGRVFGARQ